MPSSVLLGAVCLFAVSDACHGNSYRGELDWEWNSKHTGKYRRRVKGSSEGEYNYYYYEGEYEYKG